MRCLAALDGRLVATSNAGEAMQIGRAFATNLPGFYSVSFSFHVEE